MYRKCKSVHTNQYYNDPVELNPSFVIPGHEQFLKESTALYEKYRNELERLMHYFGCKHENELFIGICLGKSENNVHNGNLSHLTSIELKKIWKYYRSIFYNDQDSLEHINRDPDAKKRASAWYVACYSSNLNLQKRKIISFPWIIEDILQRIQCDYTVDQFSVSIVQNYLTLHYQTQAIATYVEFIELKQL